MLETWRVKQEGRFCWGSPVATGGLGSLGFQVEDWFFGGWEGGAEGEGKRLVSD